MSPADKPERSVAPVAPLNSLVAAVGYLTLEEVRVALKEVNHRRDVLIREEAFEGGVRSVHVPEQPTAETKTNEDFLTRSLYANAAAVVKWCADNGTDFPWLKYLRHAVGEYELLGGKE